MTNEERLLDFINNASSVEELVNGGIDKGSAEKILAKRRADGKFTDPTQFDGDDIPRPRPIFPPLKLVYRLNAIEFDYDTSACTNDAMNIRINYYTAAPSPAWQYGISKVFNDSKAAYSIVDTTGHTLGIQASFSAIGISAAFIRATGGGRLGDVKERLVMFNNGQSGFQTFQLENTTFHQFGVNIYNISWNWQWRLKQTDVWHDLQTSNHRIFITMKAPTLPWVQTVGSTSLPWTDALEIACKWAAGATTLDNAATMITSHYNGCGVVSYDTVSGQTYYGYVQYNLTAMLNRLNGGAGLGGKVNCTDSADTVATLSNLLGCDLWESRMGWGFRVNPIMAIGTNVWAVPFGWGFYYHEVAWKGACTAADSVFDGCLLVDADADPTKPPYTPLLPTNMLFGDCSTMHYRMRLSPPTPDGCVNCQPQPATSRQRRAVI